MKVLLLNSPGTKRFARDNFCGHTSKGKYYWPPTDLIVLSGIIDKKFEVDFIDAINDDIKEDQVLSSIKYGQFDYIIALTSYVSWSEDCCFFDRLKEASTAKLLLLGDIAVSCSELVLKNSFVDAIIPNFTDRRINSYLLDNNEDGVITKNDMSYVATSEEFKYSIPRYELFKLESYHHPLVKKHPFVNIVTDFGCPYRCGYCFFENIPHHLRDLDDLKNELDYLHSKGVRQLFFNDACFGGNRNRLIEICEILRGYSPKFSWVCGLRTDFVTEDVASYLKRAGCQLVTLGVETPSDDILESFNKHHGSTEAIRSFQILEDEGIDTLAHFIIGLPGETETSIQNLIRYAIKLDPGFASFNIAAPLPNSSLEKELVQNHNYQRAQLNAIDISGDEPAFELSTISKSEVKRLKSIAMRKFYLRPRYILKRLCRVRSMYQLRNLIVEGLSIIV